MSTPQATHTSRRQWLPAVAALSLALVGCGAETASDATASDAEATVAESPSPSTQAPSPSPSESPEFTPSGDFATDVAALGITPDNMASYEAHMASAMCESDLEPWATGDTELAMSVRMLGDTDPGSGQHPNVLRAAVAYNCPGRADILEDALDKAREGGFIS